MLAKDEYLAILKDFKNETENLKLTWEKSNQTSFKLKSRNNDINIIIQKYEDVRSKSNKTNFLFNVSNEQSKDIIVSIDSSTEKEFYEELYNLFQAISYNIEKSNISLLKNLISEFTDS